MLKPMIPNGSVMSAFGDGDSNASDHSDVAVPFRTLYVPMQLVSDGRLNPWESPALRGMLGKPLRDSLCRLSPLDQQIESMKRRREGHQAHRLELYCKGCPKQADCLYGQVFEPDLLMLQGSVRKGIRDGLRLATVAMPFPGPELAEAGDCLTARILAIGEAGQEILPHLLQTLIDYGARQGLGPDRVCFEVDQDSWQTEDRILRSAELPRDVQCGTIPLLHVRLGSPLSLRGFENAEAPPPGFADLVAQSLWTVMRVVRECGQQDALRDVNVRGLTDSAMAVQCEYSEWTWFEQSRSSRRQQIHGGLSSQWEFHGWTGSALYRDVPVSLLPWLTWAGHIGIGDSRVCGAGLWCLDVRC